MQASRDGLRLSFLTPKGVLLLVDQCCSGRILESLIHLNILDRTLTVGSNLDSISQTPTTIFDLEDKVEGDIQIAKGTMVRKKC